MTGQPEPHHANQYADQDDGEDAVPGPEVSPPGAFSRADVWRKLVPSIAVNAAVPLIVYEILRPHVASDMIALLVGAIIPTVFTLAKLAWRRKLDPIGVISVIGFGVSVLVLVASDGNPLVLKVQDALVTGPLGLICLVSVVIGRPLYLVVFRILAQHNPALRQRLAEPGFRKSATVATVLFGLMFAVHALVLLVLALSLPTASFLAVSRPVGLGVIGVGVVALLWYRARRQRVRSAMERSQA